MRGMRVRQTWTELYCCVGVCFARGGGLDGGGGGNGGGGGGGGVYGGANRMESAAERALRKQKSAYDKSA